MTNSNWKPVPHWSKCGVHSGYPNICTCNTGTRWHGYGERVGDFAGVWALTGWLAGLSHDAARPIERDEEMDRTYIPLPGGWEIQTRGNGSTFRVWDGKSQQRWAIQDCKWGFGHADWERMARDIHAATYAAPPSSRR